MNSTATQSWVRRLSLGVCLAVSAGLALVGWKFQPWMHAGRTVQLGTWRFGEYSFQVWQRKNRTFDEPFSTSLFIRRGTNAWHQHYLNHQDYYAPSMILRQSERQVVVCRGRVALGSVDLETGEYRRTGGGVSEENVLWEPPPGDRNRDVD